MFLGLFLSSLLPSRLSAECSESPEGTGSRASLELLSAMKNPVFSKQVYADLNPPLVGVASVRSLTQRRFSASHLGSLPFPPALLSLPSCPHQDGHWSRCRSVTDGGTPRASDSDHCQLRSNFLSPLFLRPMGGQRNGRKFLLTSQSGLPQSY